MLGGAARVDLELGLEVAHGALAGAEQLEQSHTAGMPKHAEEFRLAPIDRVRADIARPLLGVARGHCAARLCGGRVASGATIRAEASND
jgi:hypothetical protein